MVCKNGKSSKLKMLIWSFKVLQGVHVVLNAHFLHVRINMSDIAQALSIEQTEDTCSLWRQNLDDRCVLVVVDVDVALDTFFDASFFRRFEDVSVVKVLHRFGSQVNTELLQFIHLNR